MKRFHGDILLNVEELEILLPATACSDCGTPAAAGPRDATWIVRHLRHAYCPNCVRPIGQGEGEGNSKPKTSRARGGCRGDDA